MTYVAPQRVEVAPIDVNLYPRPDLQAPHLTDAVQTSGIFEDSKTYADLDWLRPLPDLEQQFLEERHLPGFRLESFVETNFGPPPPANVVVPFDGSIDDYIRHMYERELFVDLSTYRPQHGPEGGNTLIVQEGMGKIVLCGGRYGSAERPEFYGWDEYLKAIGWAAQGRWDMVRSHIETKAHMITTFGSDRNGNRTYYLDREHPPVIGMMVDLLAQYEGPSVYAEFLYAMLEEHDHYTKGASEAGEARRYDNYAKMLNGDALPVMNSTERGPRIEGLHEDKKNIIEARLHGYSDTAWHKRVACAGGHDFGPRQLEDGANLYSSNGGHIALMEHPAMLKRLEESISKAYLFLARHEPGDSDREQFFLRQAQDFQGMAQDKSRLIREWFWNDKEQFPFDLNFQRYFEDGGRGAPEKYQTGVWTAAAAWLLECEVLTQREADAVIERLEMDFLREGGLMTTIKDKPGESLNWKEAVTWPFLIYPAIKGARRYARRNPANARFAGRVQTNWGTAQEITFDQLGFFVERGHALEPGALGWGGEYDPVANFTPGMAVYLAGKRGFLQPGAFRRAGNEIHRRNGIDPALVHKIGLSAVLEQVAHRR